MEMRVVSFILVRVFHRSVHTLMALSSWPQSLNHKTHKQKDTLDNNQKELNVENVRKERGEERKTKKQGKTRRGEKTYYNIVWRQAAFQQTIYFTIADAKHLLSLILTLFIWLWLSFYLSFTYTITVGTSRFFFLYAFLLLVRLLKALRFFDNDEQFLTLLVFYFLLQA